MIARCDGFLFLTSITTIGPERTCRWEKTHPSRAPFNDPRSDPLWRSVRSAGCITATNARQREILGCFRGKARRSVRSCGVQRLRLLSFASKFCNFVPRSHRQLDPLAAPGFSCGTIPARALYGVFGMHRYSDQKSLRNVANKRARRTMVRFSRSKRRFRLKGSAM